MEGSSEYSIDRDQSFIDDFYLASLIDDLNLDSSFSSDSDAIYAHQLQLQEALISSSSTSLSQSPAADKLKHSALSGKNPVEGESSSKSTCLICLELKPSHQMFIITTCSHHFCTECMQQHLGISIQQKMAVPRCPGVECSGVLKPSICRTILPKEMLDQWETLLCESMISDSQKFYCPFEDCSSILADDGDERVLSSECPHCWRLFCAQCRVPWHSDMDCKAFQASRNQNVDAPRVV